MWFLINYINSRAAYHHHGYLLCPNILPGVYTKLKSDQRFPCEGLQQEFHKKCV
jgi:hypothetical protein